MTQPNDDPLLSRTVPPMPAEKFTMGAIPARRGDRISRALGALVEARVYPWERARKLGRRLGLAVTIDRTGWLRGATQIEVVIERESDGTIHPTAVRTAPDVADHVLLGPYGVHARCDDYNARIRTLHQLADRVAEIVRRAKARPTPGSPLAYAHHHLMRIGEQIAQRQEITMGRGVVPLSTLACEAEWFGRCDAHLGPIVVAAERTTTTMAAPRSGSPVQVPTLDEMRYANRGGPPANPAVPEERLVDGRHRETCK